MKNLDFNTPKMGYFILVRGDNSFFSRMIKKEQLNRGFTPEQAQYTHVGVSGGGPWIVDVKPPKTKVNNLGETYYNRYIRIVKLKYADYEAHKRFKIAFWAATLCNLRYDWLGVLKFKLSFIWSDAGRYFCSENACHAISQEYPGFPVNAERCMPANFTDEKLFTTVWEGVCC